MTNTCKSFSYRKGRISNIRNSSTYVENLQMSKELI